MTNETELKTIPKDEHRALASSKATEPRNGGRNNLTMKIEIISP